MTINELTKEEVNKAILSLEQKISAVSNNAKNVYEPKQNFVVKPGSITSKELANGAVTSNKLANGTVTTDKIADSAIDASKIVDEAITAAKIENAAITGDKIGSEAITSDKIAEFAITAGLLADGSVNTDKLADDSISSDKIKDGNVSTAKIAAEAITTSLIASGAVNTAKLADDSITTDKINTGAITTAKIANDAISSDLIKAKAITGVKIEDRTIEAVKIAAGTITANEIKAGTITANEIKSGSLSIGVFNDIDKSTIESASPAAQKAIASAQAALASANAASSSADDASGYATSASGYATSASGYADSASGYADAASSSADTASGYATNASNSADAASDSASEASGYASAANASADSASGYADTASSKATAASSSASAAKSSASTASSKATAASGYADAASSSASEASGYATSASGYATNASSSASAAKSSADTASSKATAASSSASAAKSSASTASSKASAAATSATNAATSEANAATSEANAASSASAAAASETEAKTQADYVRDFDKNWDTKVANTMINGQTLIVGGYLNTGIIEAKAISADKIAAHTLTSAQMKIGNGVNRLAFGMDTFEQWDKFYGTVTRGTATIQNAYPTAVFSGTKSLQLKNTSGTDTYCYLGETNWKINTNYSNNGTNKFVLSCYVRRDSATTVETTVQLYVAGYKAASDTSVTAHKGTTLVLKDNNWHRLEVAFDGGGSYTFIRPRVDIDTTGAQCFFDAFQLEEVESGQGAGPFSPAGATIINGGNIITSTVDAAQIKANAVTADKIATGAVIADKIAAGAISASKLLVSDVNNLVDFNGTNDVFISDDFTISSDKTYLTRAAKRDTYLNKTIACKPGEKYYFSFDVKLNTAGSNQDRVLNFGVFNLASTWTAVATASGITTSWKSVSGVYTVPSGLTKFKPWIQQNLTEGFSTFDVRNVILYKQEKAVLIEDGTITASKISANTIVSSKMATETLNVLANSLVTNPTVSQSTRGWSQNSYVTWDSTEKAIKVARNGASGLTFESDSFKVGPKDILKVRFKIKATGTFTANQGLYFGPKYNSSWYPIAWDATNRQWAKKERVSGNTSTNAYFINDFKTTTDYVLFETFILGNGYTVTENSKTYIDVTQLHSPITTGNVYAIQCTSDNQVCTLRAGFNASASGQAWYIKDIEVTPVNSGLITADQIIANSITADKINTNGLSVNTAYSSNFSNIPGSEAGFFMNGTDSAITLANGSVVPAQTEYHYGNAVYDSDYIKNSDTNLCIALGHNAGYKTPIRGTWDANTSYFTKDIVIYNNKYFYSINSSNKGNIPSDSASYWKELNDVEADSVAVGSSALKSNTTGDSNTAVGSSALKSNTTGYSNTAVGSSALKSNTTGCYNTAVGAGALTSSDNGYSNTAVGSSALKSNITGDSNTAVGTGALTSNNNGYSNTAVGSSALWRCTSGKNNIAIGNVAGHWITTGSNNICIGKDYGHPVDTGSNNIFIGYSESPTYRFSGSNNIRIGYNTHPSSNTASNEINIGNRIFANSDGVYIGTAWDKKKTLHGWDYLTDLATRTANSGSTYYVASYELFDTTNTNTIYLIIARWGDGSSMKMVMSLMKYNGQGVGAWICDLGNNGGIASNGYSVGAGSNGSGLYDTSLRNIAFYSIPMW